MAIVEINFRPWTSKASLSIQIGDVVSPRFRLRAALELIAGEIRDGKRSRADLRGADLRGADLRGADLRGADLTDADLRGADLRGADLTGADLRDADLRDADLRGADLRGADLTGADLRDADLRGADLRDDAIPALPEIDVQILAAIEASKKAGNDGIEMSQWHTCETTHCRAGWAITLAGEAGRDLERKVGSAVAGTLIYLKSTPDEPIPNFYATNAAAMADIRARAERQIAARAK